METGLIIFISDEVRALHNCGNESTKQVMEKKCPDLFKPEYESVWDKFLADHKLNIKLPFPGTNNREEQRTNAHHMLIHIVPIERGDWEPDYNNRNQWKYEPRFDMRSSSGFGLSRYVAMAGVRLRTPAPALLLRREIACVLS